MTFLGLTRIQLIIVAGLLVVALIGGAILYIYNKGETAGTAKVTNAVQSETIKTLDAARKAKDQADQDVRATPYEGRVDGLR